MRKTTKFLTLVLAVLMVASMFITGASAAFADVDYSSAEGEAVSLLVSLGVAKGKNETEFGTNTPVTRQEMSAFLYRMMKAGRQEPNGGANTTSFTDLVDAYFNYTISWADNTGIIKGVSETKFNPTGNITLRDAYTMVVRALGYEDGTTLSYPIGYIEIAEEIGLDEDLPSDLGYTDELTRGQVAIILKNAFYADMADYDLVKERTYKYTYVDADGNVDEVTSLKNIPADVQIVSVTSTIDSEIDVKKYDTIASEIFGVEKITQYVVATPNYAIDGKERTDDEDAVFVEFGSIGRFSSESDDDTVRVSDYEIETIEFAELGLPGEADDYFMAGIELYVKLEDDGDKTVLGAHSLLSKKSVDGADVVIGKVTGSSAENYYDGDDKEYKMMNGLLTIDGVKTYIFNAPYGYGDTKSVDDKNKFNAQFIEYGAYNPDNAIEDLDEDEAIDEVYSIVVLEDLVFNNSNKKTDGVKNDDDEELFYNFFEQAYHGGFYGLDVYDVDGDGFYDFINYKKYSVAEIDTTEGNSLVEDSDFANDMTLYTDKTIVKVAEGVEFAKKDIVLAYVAPEANYAEIVAVLEGEETRVNSKGKDYVKFANGVKHVIDEFANDVVVANADLPTSFAVGDEGAFFFYNNKLVYTDAVGSTDFDLNSDWVMVLSADVEEVKVMDGDSITKSYMAEIYHDGVIKNVKIKKIYADVMDGDEVKVNGNADRYDYSPVNFDYENRSAGEAAYDFAEYVGKLAVAKTDSNGLYYFELAELLYADRMDGYIDEETGETLDPAADLADEEDDCEYMYTSDAVSLYKATGNRYNITDNGEASFTQVIMQEYTQIIIRSIDEDGEEIFTLFDAENLPSFDKETVFTNATVIVKNYLNSDKRENLAVFYGEARDADDNLVEIEDAAGKSIDYRVVLGWYEGEDENEESVWTYTVFDPKTGATTEEVLGADEASDVTAAGWVAAFLDTDKLDNTVEGYYGNIFMPGYAELTGGEDDDKTINSKDFDINTYGLGYLEVTGYDEEAGLLEVATEAVGYKPASYDAITSFNVTSSTKVLLANAEDETIEEVSIDALTGTNKKFYENGEKKNSDGTEKNLKVFVMATLNTKDSDDDAGLEIYDATTIIIVRNK